MAEAVLSIALQTIRDLLLEEGRFLAGVADQVKELQRQLKEMKCFLEDADKRRHESRTISNWITEIRDLVYRSEHAAYQVYSRRRGLSSSSANTPAFWKIQWGYWESFLTWISTKFATSLQSSSRTSLYPGGGDGVGDVRVRVVHLPALTVVMLMKEDLLQHLSFLENIDARLTNYM
ncbi:putative disease resistance protein [Salvia divinorum]|uniref:Disease resistance protein n=1 Tax=Salvia divinorum TaxID=28513 RepID=A0ABD1HHH6_SALDI